MTGMIRDLVGRFFGGSGQSITVPVMDGPLKANDYLERAAPLARLTSADNLARRGDRVVLSAGSTVFELAENGTPDPIAHLDSVVTCLAGSEGGALAIGLESGGIAISGGRHDGVTVTAAAGYGALNCPTAAAFVDEDTLVVCNGSRNRGTREWTRDLLERGASGAVVAVNLASKSATTLLRNVAYPAGICRVGARSVVISEAWSHRLLVVDVDQRDGRARVVLEDLPGYPGRIVRSATSGYWLAMFAARTQLQEFVLRERRYCREMMATVDPEYWIAPALSSGRSFKEPLQAGGVIRLGIHKPWAPSRSYGLLVRLDEEFAPVWSAHSRANGSRHGVTSIVEERGRVLATSKGAGEILALAHTSLEEPDDLSVEPGAAA